MNPIKETWEAYGWKMWKRSTFGSWKEQALTNRGAAQELRNLLTSQVAEAYDAGWRAGWKEAIDMAGIKVSFEVKDHD